MARQASGPTTVPELTSGGRSVIPLAVRAFVAAACRCGSAEKPWVPAKRHWPCDSARCLPPGVAPGPKRRRARLRLVVRAHYGGEVGPVAVASSVKAPSRSATCLAGTNKPVWESEEFNAEWAARAEAIVAAQRCNTPATWQALYERRAQRYWDTFYKHNQANFFKDRHYLHKTFAEDLGPAAHEPRSLLEIGCGVGNALLPLMRDLPFLRGYGLDLSKRAVQLLRDSTSFNSMRGGAYVCDATADPLPAEVRAREPEGVDVAIMLFMLSAVAPSKMATAFKFAFELVMRDYGKFDAAQLRFAPRNRLSEDFYVRSDGTCSFFFTVDRVQELALGAGFEVVHCGYIRRAYHMRKKDTLHRVWVQARFRRPA